MKKLVVPTHKLLDSLFKYVIAAVLVFIPLYPKFPLFTVPYTYVQIRAEDFLIAAIWGIFILRSLVVKKIKFPPVTYSIVIYFLVGLISLLSAIFITKNIFPSVAVLHFFRRVEYLSIFFLVYWASKDQSSRKYYLELILLSAIGVLLYGLAQIYLNAPVISTMDAEASKGMALTLRPGVPLSSTFAGHYDLAVYLIMILSFLTSLLCSIKDWLKRLPILVFFVAILWLFMQAGSRIGLLGLFLSVALICYLYRRYLLGLILLIVMSAFVIATPSFISRFQTIIKVFTSQVILIKPALAVAIAPSATPAAIPTEAIRSIQQDTSTSIRFDVEWPMSLRSFYKNPLLGTGYSSLGLATDNDYLRALGETGLVGLLAFLSILIALFNKLKSGLKDQEGINKIISISAMGIFVSFLVIAVFLDVFESSKIAILFWAYMGLALSIKS
ncbi:O-antigen ligase domain-containing protein [bacterium]|nr:MAG: O-antigen ligase domain-containing protein [bacterium]